MPYVRLKTKKSFMNSDFCFRKKKDTGYIDCFLDRLKYNDIPDFNDLHPIHYTEITGANWTGAVIFIHNTMFNLYEQRIIDEVIMDEELGRKLANYYDALRRSGEFKGL